MADKTPTIVGMIDATTGRPATIYTPPEALQRDPARWPTAHEFVDEWEQHSDERRVALAERILKDAQRADECILMAHDSIEGRAKAAEVRRDAAIAALVGINAFAKTRAVTARAMGHLDTERHWLDVLALVERGLS